MSQTINHSGAHGASYGKAASGHSGVSGTGSPGGSGRNGIPGGAGQSARPINATFNFVGGAIVVSEPTHEPFIFEVGRGDSNRLTMEANGGNGGKGEDGGNGGNGGSGRPGRDATRYSSGTNGGPGGSGGSGGNGGRGGNAGHGANITITVDEEDLDLLMVMKQRNPTTRAGTQGTGGAGGAGGAGGRGGRGGSSYTWTETHGCGENSYTTTHTNPGGRAGPSGRSGSSGTRGAAGDSGRNGQLSYHVQGPRNAIYNELYDLRIKNVVLREQLGYGLFEPNCTVLMDSQVQNPTNMPTPKQPITYYVSDQKWVHCAPENYVALPTHFFGSKPAPTVEFQVPQTKAPVIGHELHDAIKLDHRALMSRVGQEFCWVKDHTTNMEIQYPVTITKVSHATCISMGEEAPFIFKVENVSKLPIGSAVEGPLTRDLHVGVCASFDAGKTPNYGTLSPQDILLKDQDGNVLPSLFYNIDLLKPGEVKYISGTLSFTNPHIPPLTSVELRATLMLGQPLARGGSPGDAIPIQIMPFKIQIAAYYAHDAEADFLLVVNHRTTFVESERWKENVKELGGKMNIWNLSLHRDFVLTEKLSHGKSLFEDFTCQTVIILNNEIEEFWDGRRVSNSHEYLRETDLLDGARDYGINFIFVGSRLAIANHLEPIKETKWDKNYFESQDKFKASLKMQNKKTHPFPATASSDLCGPFKEGSKTRWLSLFAEDHLIATYKSPTDRAPYDMFFTERMEAILRPLDGDDFELELKSGGQSSSFRINDSEEISKKYESRDNFCNDMEAWVSKLGGMEEVRVIREGVASLEGGFAQGLAGDGASMRATLDVEAQSFSLNLCVNEAENLPKMDTVGRIDAYVVVMDTSGRKHRTPTIKNQYHPKWNYDIQIDVTIDEAVEILVYDHDSLKDDELAARCTFIPGELLQKRLLQLELNPEKKTSKTPTLTISTKTVLKAAGEVSVFGSSKDTIHGNLERKTKFKWKKSYYVLKSQSKRLEYYTNQYAEELDGCIFLASYAFEKDLESMRNDGKKEFTILTPESKYTLRAKSAEEKLRWVQSLSEMCPQDSLSAINALSSPSSSQSDLNVGVKATYAAAISSGMGVGESSSLLNVTEQNLVSRVQIVDSFFTGEPDVYKFEKRVKELKERCLEICPNQRLVYVTNYDDEKLGTFQHRLGYVEIHRSLDRTKRHISSIVSDSIHEPEWVSNTRTKLLLVTSLGFEHKLRILDNFLAKEATGKTNINQTNSYGYAAAGVVSDLICEANHFKRYDAFDLSDLHTQLSCLKQLSEFQWKSKDDEKFGAAIMELIYHLRRFIKADKVDDRIFFKRPFVRRSMDKSLLEASKKITDMDSDSLKRALKDHKRLNPFKNTYTDLTSTASDFESDLHHEMNDATTIIRLGSFNNQLRIPKESKLFEMKYKIRDNSHRTELILEQMRNLTHGTIGRGPDSWVPLTMFPEEFFFTCVGISTLE